MSTTIFLKYKELLEVTPVENIFIAQFMPLAPELAVKAYLYGLMLLSGAGTGSEDISAALGCSQNDIRAAFAYWESVGIVRVISEDPIQVVFLNIKNALLRSSVDTRGAVRGEFVKRLQAVFGTRVLTGSELSKIYDWLDVFGLEEDAAIELAKHFLDKKGARTSVSYMDAAARSLAGRGSLTAEAVREHFKAEEALANGAAYILRRWNRRRPPTEDEISLYEKWTRGWGFDDDGIGLALERMTAAEKPTFKYLDSLLETWHREGSVDRTSIDRMQKEEDLVYELARQAFARAGLKTKPNTEQRLLFREWHIEKCMSAELILYAAELSKNDLRPFAMMKRIIGEWYAHGISGVNEAREYYEREQGSMRPSARKNNRALNYSQGKKYTQDDLKNLGISLGEEIFGGNE